jgi:hypothetical protein
MCNGLYDTVQWLSASVGNLSRCSVNLSNLRGPISFFSFVPSGSIPIFFNQAISIEAILDLFFSSTPIVSLLDPTPNDLPSSLYATRLSNKSPNPLLLLSQPSCAPLDVTDHASLQLLRLLFSRQHPMRYPTPSLHVLRAAETDSSLLPLGDAILRTLPRTCFRSFLSRRRPCLSRNPCCCSTRRSRHVLQNEPLGVNPIESRWDQSRKLLNPAKVCCGGKQ